MLIVGDVTSLSLVSPPEDSLLEGVQSDVSLCCTVSVQQTILVLILVTKSTFSHPFSNPRLRPPRQTVLYNIYMSVMLLGVLQTPSFSLLAFFALLHLPNLHAPRTSSWTAFTTPNS